MLEVNRKYDIKTEKGCYPLEVFGYSNGKCPHCKSPNIDATNVNNSVKLIYTSDDPRFVQGVGLKCKSFRRKSCKTGHSMQTAVN
mmetsp:Transcript_29151/g.43800  ORF Transcript_29151/g.43800 Transcript_29151/m.43800 type:complete len:85 (+) Transcript_29151:439-693(+)